MPQKTITYICDKCGSESESEQEAIECESEHLVPSEVKPLHYCKEEKYPDTIEVKFSDGSIETYTQPPYQYLTK